MAPDIKFLLIGSEPAEASSVSLVSEHEILARSLRRNDRFRFDANLRTRAENLPVLLAEQRPHCVHFCGHGSEEGDLLFEDDHGHPHFVDAAHITALFEALDHPVRCVVLNACFTRIQAEQLIRHVDAVVAMSHLLESREALAFARGFYDMLSAEQSIGIAFKMARLQINLQGIASHAVPRLLVRDGLDPNTLYFDDPHRGTPANDDSKLVPLLETPRSDLEMILVPGGRFVMGSPSFEFDRDSRDQREAQHELEIASFYLASSPITNAQYRRYMDADDGVKSPGFWADEGFNDDDQPVVGVSWDEALAYCNWAGLTLPTDAQWEYACRAGTTYAYHSGDEVANLGEVAWYRDNSGPSLRRVAHKQPNPFGLFDMHGNVSEWCLDPWTSGPRAPRMGDGLCHELDRSTRCDRCHRGGGWKFSPAHLRSAARHFSDSTSRYSWLGFRPALLISDVNPSTAKDP